MSESTNEIKTENQSEHQIRSTNILSSIRRRLSDVRHKEKKETLDSVKDVRAKIIDSILIQGLKSSAILQKEGTGFLGSVESIPLETLYGRVLKPIGEYRDGHVFKNAVTQALYNTDNSCLTVIVERHGESLNDIGFYKYVPGLKEKLSQRANASFLVVTAADSSSWGTYNPREGQTRPEDFIAVIMPDKIFRDYDPDLTKTNKFRIIPVTKQIKRGLYGYSKDPLRVPDYEQAIQMLAQELNTTLWIHGVRLPTGEDQARFNQHNG